MTTRTLRFSLIVLSLGLTCLAAESETATDHYDQPNYHRSFNEALKVLRSHRFDLHAKKTYSKEQYPINNNIVPDLQVGCGDGLLVETTTTKPVIPKHKHIFTKKERRKRATGERIPRNYFGYTFHSPGSYAYSAWKAQPYKLERPYFIPVVTLHNRFPFYFPPQPLSSNPGFPLDNPPKPYGPPIKEYLPPSPTTEKIPKPSPVEIADRFGPIWDTVSTSTTRGPTRRPNRPKTSTFPPLIHNSDPEPGTPRNEILESSPTRPPRGNDVIKDIFSLSTTTSTIVPPTAQTENNASGSESNRCAWAIINCCSTATENIRLACFSRLGCPGPFWDRSPCEGEFARKAVEYALNYYEAK